MNDSRTETSGGAGPEARTDAEVLAGVRFVLADALGLGTQVLEPETPLLGHLPEFDSMAVVAIVTALEERYGIFVDDDELSAEVFETVGSLARFIMEKIRR